MKNWPTPNRREPEEGLFPLPDKNFYRLVKDTPAALPHAKPPACRAHQAGDERRLEKQT